jgi:hypothetical protein
VYVHGVSNKYAFNIMMGIILLLLFLLILLHAEILFKTFKNLTDFKIVLFLKFAALSLLFLTYVFHLLLNLLLVFHLAHTNLYDFWFFWHISVFI